MTKEVEASSEMLDGYGEGDEEQPRVLILFAQPRSDDIGKIIFSLFPLCHVRFFVATEWSVLTIRKSHDSTEMLSVVLISSNYRISVSLPICRWHPTECSHAEKGKGKGQSKCRHDSFGSAPIRFCSGRCLAVEKGFGTLVLSWR